MTIYGGFFFLNIYFVCVNFLYTSKCHDFIAMSYEYYKIFTIEPI